MTIHICSVFIILFLPELHGAVHHHLSADCVEQLLVLPDDETWQQGEQLALGIRKLRFNFSLTAAYLVNCPI